MMKTLTGLTRAAAVVFTVGGAVAQQAGGGPQPQLGTSTPNAQNATTRRGNTASLAERRRSAKRDDPAADCWRWPGEQCDVY
jgi:hypothetical protein